MCESFIFHPGTKEVVFKQSSVPKLNRLTFCLHVSYYQMISGVIFEFVSFWIMFSICSVLPYDHAH